MWRLVWAWCIFNLKPFCICIWLRKGYSPNCKFKQFMFGFDIYCKANSYTSKTLPKIVNIGLP